MLASRGFTTVSTVRKGMVVGVLLNLALVGYGVLRVPTIWTASTGGARSVAGALAILAVYALIGLAGPAATTGIEPRILPTALRAGILAGGVFALEMLLEYAILPEDNTTMGIVEFGTVFFLYLVAGVRIATKTRRVRHAVLGAVWSAVIGSLIWFAAVLLITYLFGDTSRQVAVFRAEGNSDDYRRSGMRDFNAFILEDFMGAGFFHLLLGPLIAALLGSIGGWIGKGLARFRSRTRTA
jgi:hypothetical protein